MATLVGQLIPAAPTSLQGGQSFYSGPKASVGFWLSTGMGRQTAVGADLFTFLTDQTPGTQPSRLRLVPGRATHP